MQFYTPLNNAASYLTSAHAIGDNSLVINDASPFGTPSPSAPVRVSSGGTIFKVVGVTGNTLTIGGVLEGTSDTAIPQNTAVEARLTAGHLSDLTDAVGLLATIASPSFTGNPSAPTPVSSDASTRLATTAFVAAQGFLTSSSGVTTFNTRTGNVSLAGSDVTTALGYTPVNPASPTLTGTPVAPTATVGTNTTQIATTAYVMASGFEQTANKGQNSGYASLDSGGKVPTSQLPAAVLGSVDYQGTWDANANSPTLTSGVGSKGFYYKVSVSGTTSVDGNAAWHVGDWIVFDGTTWDKIDNYEAVTTVAGRTGAITLANTDISGLGTASTHAATDFLTPTGSGSSLSGIPSSVSNSDGTLTIFPTTGAVVASLALNHANTWTSLQTFHPSVATNQGLVAQGAASSATITFVANNGGGLATVTTASPHGFSAGQMVAISGLSHATYNGNKWIINTVPTSTTFTFSFQPTVAALATAADSGVATATTQVAGLITCNDAVGNVNVSLGSPTLPLVVYGSTSSPSLSAQQDFVRVVDQMTGGTLVSFGTANSAWNNGQFFANSGYNLGYVSVGSAGGTTQILGNLNINGSTWPGVVFRGGQKLGANSAGSLGAVCVSFLFREQGSEGVQFAAISTTGNVFNSITSSAIPLVAQGFASQSVDLQQWQNSSGTPVARVDKNGAIASGSSTTGSRPTVVTVGARWFDTSLGIPIWWNGSSWVNANGSAV